MKKSKKIVSLLAIIFLLSTTLNVYAADYSDAPTSSTAEITLTPSATEVKAGDTVTITLSAKCETGIGELNASLEWDTTKIKLKEIEEHEYYTSLSGTDGEKQMITIFYGDELGNAPEENPTEIEELVKLKFEVLNMVTEAETLNIKLSTIEFVDANEAYDSPEDKEVTLTVVGEQKPGEEEKPGDEGQNPGGEGKPGDEGQNPGGEGNQGDEKQDPAGEQKPSNEPKDPTTADKPINNAGLEAYGLMGIVGIAFVAIVLYVKCKKYSDVK